MMVNNGVAQTTDKTCTIMNVQSTRECCLMQPQGKMEYLNLSWDLRCFSMCRRVSNLDSGVNTEGLFQNAKSSSLSSDFFVLCSSSCVSGTWRWSLFSIEDELGKANRPRACKPKSRHRSLSFNASS